MTRCTRCGERWQNDGTLCRRCARGMGVVTEPDLRYGPERYRIVRQEAAIVRVPDDDLMPRPARSLVVNGVEWDVNWDGS